MLGETKSSGSDLDPIKQLLRICQQESVADTDLETIRNLVSRGDVDINQLIEESKGFFTTPLYRACVHSNFRVVQCLVECGADVNAGITIILEDGTINATPLQQAAIRGNLEIAEFLVDKGADINAECQNGYTPLLRACQHNRSEVAIYLLDKGVKNVNQRNKSGIDITIFYAIQHNDNKLLNKLLDCGADIELENLDRETPLIYAARWGQYECAMSLIDRGADAKRGSIHGSAIYAIQNSKELEQAQKINLLNPIFSTIYGFSTDKVKKAYEFHADNKKVLSWKDVLEIMLFTQDSINFLGDDVVEKIISFYIKDSSKLMHFLKSELPEVFCDAESRSVSAGGAKGVRGASALPAVNPTAEQVGKDFSANVAAARGATGYTGEDDSRAVRVVEGKSENDNNLPMPGFGSDNPSSAGDSTHAAVLAAQRNQELANRGAGGF